MEITYFGHSCFKLKGKNASLVTDPYDPKQTGLKLPKIETNIITISHNHPGHNFKSTIEGNPIVFSGPGEYEAKGIKVMGFATWHDSEKGQVKGKNTIYKIEIDRLSLVHCGDLGHKVEENILDALGEVDILLIPVGGLDTLTPAVAIEVIAQFEPRIVIPMHYKIEGMNESVFGAMLPVTQFLKEAGKEGLVKVPKFAVTKDKLPEEQTIIVLE